MNYARSDCIIIQDSYLFQSIHSNLHLEKSFTILFCAADMSSIMSVRWETDKKGYFRILLAFRYEDGLSM